MLAPLSVRLAPSRFLDPIVVLLVAMAIALFFAHRGQRAETASARRGRVGTWVVLALFWVVSTPTFADRLVHAIEVRPTDVAAAIAGVPSEKVALVVLAGGLRTAHPGAPPRERLDVSTDARVRGAARIFAQHPIGLVVLSGGPAIEAEGMRDLITSLGVPSERIVLEPASKNTRENAAFTAPILRARGVERVLLATSATHLYRARKDFERAGIATIPAPVDVIGLPPWGVDALLPSSWALGKSHRALHEVLGWLKP